MIGECTIVMPYYENPNMLVVHLETWARWPLWLRERIRLVIVDDGSPTSPALAAIRFAGLPVRSLMQLTLFRIIPNIPWNQDGARNLGMKHVGTEWAYMTDMDHLFTAEQAEQMLRFDGQPKNYYMPAQIETTGVSVGRPHPNSYLMRAADFWGMGGYDEDFAGFYGSDGNFRRCAQGAGLLEKHTDAFSTTVYRTHDCYDANTKDFGRKGSAFHVAFNPVLMAKKALPPYRAVNQIRFAWERVL